MRIGVIGGLGPLATAKFMEMLARRFAEHHEPVELAVISDPTTPDRTSYILGSSKENPVGSILAMVDRLAALGCGLLVMPCNTASYFYREIEARTDIKFINIVEETVKFLVQRGVKKVGLLATEGTVNSGIYKELLDQAGIELAVPDEAGQKTVSAIIYEGIKKGAPVDLDAFFEVVRSLEALGCERVILGCTELSALKELYRLGDPVLLDAMDVLADSTLAFATGV